MSGKINLAVFVSGGGTNLQAIVDACEAGRIDATVGVVVSNNPDAYGLTRAQNHGISTVVVDYSVFSRRRMPKIPLHQITRELDEVLPHQKIFSGPRGEVEEKMARIVLAEKELIRKLQPYTIDLVCLSGYMRLLTPHFINVFNWGETHRIMNIHPALLPSFPGEHGYEDTYNYGCRFGGVTTHFVDEGEDTGPIIAQAVYPIFPGDEIETIRQRGLKLEYQIYPQSIQWYARGELVVEKRGRRNVVSIGAADAKDFFLNLERDIFSEREAREANESV